MRPALFVAIALHAVLLLLPLPQEQKTTVKPSKRQTIRLLKPSKAPVQPTNATATQARTVIRSSPTRPTQLTSAPSSIVLKPVPSKVQSQPVKTANTAKQTTSDPSAPLVQPPASDLQIPFSGFPDLAGAQAGCFGSGGCRQVGNGTAFRDAAQTLVQQMENQGYHVSERDDLADTGQKIYEVAADGRTRYLNVLSAGVGETIYLLASEPLTLSDLKQAKTIQTKLDGLLTQMGSPATVVQVPYPTLFLKGTGPRSEIQQLRWVADGNLTQVMQRLTTTLKTQQFNLTSVGTYGGGTVYEVAQKAFTGYVNLVPTPGRKGTLMVLWKTVPS